MFYDDLAIRCVDDRAYLLAAPIVQDTLKGVASRDSYVAYLTQAYHHVRHTVPLLMLMGGRLPERLAWMRDNVAEYIDEERGHDAWILADIRASGGDVTTLTPPGLPVEVMIAYAYDLLQRGNPAAFLGMVYVLEGTSVELALHAAARIQTATGLPDGAFSYLRSHGTLDQQHTQHLAALLDRLDAADREDVAHRARVFYRLYADLFYALPRSQQEVTCN
ncbi:MAG: iron-containing redox enzyme family protein [Proteobacteria bacterium]|nr:iron-containing redox enzyme family protein [Pseudomonadota bacterium]